MEPTTVTSIVMIVFAVCMIIVGIRNLLGPGAHHPPFAGIG